jgi:uncharacterized UBP type Zn finger protein
LSLSVLGSSTSIQCLDSFFASISLQAEVLKTQQHFIGSFPMFLFLNLGREEWQFVHMEKDFRPITFRVMLDMTPCAFQRRSPCKYQLAAVISHMGDLGESQGHYITFIKVFARWFRFDHRNVDAVEKSAAVQENFPQAESSTQTASILLYMGDN